jgi:hypothetical protein
LHIDSSWKLNILADRRGIIRYVILKFNYIKKNKKINNLILLIIDNIDEILSENKRNKKIENLVAY